MKGRRWPRPSRMCCATSRRASRRSATSSPQRWNRSFGGCSNAVRSQALCLGRRSPPGPVASRKRRVSCRGRWWPISFPVNPSAARPPAPPPAPAQWAHPLRAASLAHPGRHWRCPRLLFLAASRTTPVDALRPGPGPSRRTRPRHRRRNRRRTRYGPIPPRWLAAANTAATAAGRHYPARIRHVVTAHRHRRGLVASAGARVLDIACRPWASVYLGDSLVGTTPLPSALKLPPGVHNLVLLNPEIGLPISRAVTVAGGKTTELRINLYDYVARIRIAVRQAVGRCLCQRQARTAHARPPK